MTQNYNTGERLVIIMLGAISGLFSLAILFEYVQANLWLSPILGVLSLILFAMVISEERVDEEYSAV